MTSPGPEPVVQRGGTAKATRAIAYLAYYLVLIHLPRSYAPGGSLALKLRGWAARQLLDYAGEDVNVENGAVFGSGRGVRLGARSGLGIDAEIHGSVIIGDDVMMGPGCTLMSRNHKISDVTTPMNQQGFAEDRPIVIEDDVWFGANVTVTSGVRVGHGSVLGAGCVVTSDVPPYSVVGGVPARVLRSRLDAPDATKDAAAGAPLPEGQRPRQAGEY